MILTHDSQRSINVFDFEGKEVRTVIKDGQPWWVAKDVCDIFGETNRNRAMQALYEDEKGYTQMNTPGGMQQIAIINESGLYSLLFAMQPSKARGVTDEYIRIRETQLRKFRRWITHEILPSIRKDGAYLTDAKIEEVLADPDTIIQLATKLKREREQVKALEAQAEQNAPKVLFADTVAASETSIGVGRLAKYLKQSGTDTGEKRFYETLRKDGFCRKSGSDRNLPTQRSMELGIMEIRESSIALPDGRIKLRGTTKITGKGQLYFIQKYGGANKEAVINEITGLQ